MGFCVSDTVTGLSTWQVKGGAVLCKITFPLILKTIFCSFQVQLCDGWMMKHTW